MDDTTKEIHSRSGISQQGSANEIYAVIALTPEIQQDVTLSAVRETNVNRLRRGLCLPSATATCINSALRERKISEENSGDLLGLSSIYQTLFRYHNKVGLTNEAGAIYDKPWFAVNQQGDMYHQAGIAIANGFGLEALSIGNFPNLDQVIKFVGYGGKVALSLNNSFVIDQSLRKDPSLVKEENGSYFILIENPAEQQFVKFENGRHVVSLLDITADGKIIIHDSFSLPQQDEPHGIIMELEKDVLERYLVDSKGGKSRAIVFSKSPELLDPLRPFETFGFIPKDLVGDIKQLVAKKTTILK